MIHHKLAGAALALLALLAAQQAPAHAVTNEGTAATVDEIDFSDASLPDGYYGEFQVRALMPDELEEPLPFIRLVEKPHGDELR